MAECTCPVFQPTEEQFTNFHAYIKLIEQRFPGMGICKIIPPKSWYVREYDIANIDLKIDTPIRQVGNGRDGSYRIDLIESSPMTVQQMQAFGEINKFDCDDYVEREKKFWRCVMSGISGLGDPIYGADVAGSLFANSPQLSHPSWDLNKLENLLRVIQDEIPGVNSPMLYVGSWRALFAYHVEDMDLYSINYLHYGEAKSWYSIPPKYRKQFENIAEIYFGEDHRRCREYLRHKTFLFSPKLLKQRGVEVQTVIQFPGEFVITFPGGYHAGFNHGFNIAEATNFATRRWIDIGRHAKPCLCRPQCVHIDVEQLETYILREKVKRRKYKQALLLRQQQQQDDDDDEEDAADQIPSTGLLDRILADEDADQEEEESLLVQTGQCDVNSEGYFDESKYRVRCFCNMTWNSNVSYGGISPVTFMLMKQSKTPSFSMKPPVEASESYRKRKRDSSNTKGTSLKDLETRELVLCTTCELWFHPECVLTKYREDIEQRGYDFSYLSIPICHVCHIIEHSHCFDASLPTTTCSSSSTDNEIIRQFAINQVMHRDRAFVPTLSPSFPVQKNTSSNHKKKTKLLGNGTTAVSPNHH